MYQLCNRLLCLTGSHDVAVLGSTVSNQTEHTVLLPLGEEPAENRRVTLNLGTPSTVEI